jgi:hypothetical protein
MPTVTQKQAKVADSLRNFRRRWRMSQETFSFLAIIPLDKLKRLEDHSEPWTLEDLVHLDCFARCKLERMNNELGKRLSAIQNEMQRCESKKSIDSGAGATAWGPVCHSIVHPRISERLYDLLKKLGRLRRSAQFKAAKTHFHAELKGQMTKTVIALALALGGAAHAQTNVTFTNSSGLVITNAEVIRWDKANLIYRSGSAMGAVKLSSLPEELRERFGFDAESAKASEAREKSRREADSRMLAAEKAVAIDEFKSKKAKSQAAKTATIVRAKVVQVLKEGLLIHAESVGNGEYTTTPEYRSLRDKVGVGNDYWKVPRADGFILLKHYPSSRSAVDGDAFVTVAYPLGLFDYVTVTGAKSTIRVYYWDVETVAANLEASN